MVRPRYDAKLLARAEHFGVRRGRFASWRYVELNLNNYFPDFVLASDFKYNHSIEYIDLPAIVILPKDLMIASK